MGNSQNYLSLYTANEKIHLDIKLDGQVKTISTASNVKLDQHVNIEFERIGTRIRLEVDGVPVNDAISGDMFDVTSNDLIYIGKDQITQEVTGLPGCIQEIMINDEHIGLWKFEKTKGDCGGCKR